MRRFGAWLGVALLVYGGFWAAHHTLYTANPRKILVGIDTSAQMDGSARELRNAIAAVGDERYAVFSLVVDKGRRIHSWAADLQLDQTPVFYGERQFDAFTDANAMPEIDEADTLVLISNAQDVGDVANAYRDFRQVFP